MEDGGILQEVVQTTHRPRYEEKRLPGACRHQLLDDEQAGKRRKYDGRGSGKNLPQAWL